MPLCLPKAEGPLLQDDEDEDDDDEDSDGDSSASVSFKAPSLSASLPEGEIFAVLLENEVGSPLKAREWQMYVFPFRQAS